MRCMRYLHTPLLLLAFAVALAVSPSSARAAVGIHDEPSWTKGTANTWYFDYSYAAPAAGESRGAPGSCTGYGFTEPGRTCPRNSYCLWWGEGTTAADAVHGIGEGSNCYYPDPDDPPAPAVSTPTAALSSMVSGTSYVVCIRDYRYSDETPVGWVAVSAQPACETTRMDAVAPATSVQVDEGAAYAKDTSFEVRFTFGDVHSGPWPQTFGCLAPGTTCAPDNALNMCSNYPAMGPSCTLQYSGADGTIAVCGRVMDHAVPDVPNSPNQLRDALARNANSSPAACDTVVLDRTKPTGKVKLDPPTPRAGEYFSFDLDFEDATSGMDPDGYWWSFGGKLTGTVPSTRLILPDPGTSTLVVQVRDRAGHTHTETMKVTVVEATAGTPPTSPPGPPTSPPGPLPSSPLSPQAAPAPAPPLRTAPTGATRPTSAGKQATMAGDPTPDDLVAQMHLAGRRLTPDRKGELRVGRVTCGTREVRCRVRASVEATVRVGRRGTRRVTVGAARLSVLRGGTRNVTVRLKRPHRAALTRLGSVPVVVTLIVEDSSGNERSVTSRAVLRQRR